MCLFLKFNKIIFSFIAKRMFWDHKTKRFIFFEFLILHKMIYYANRRFTFFEFNIFHFIFINLNNLLIILIFCLI